MVYISERSREGIEQLQGARIALDIKDIINDQIIEYKTVKTIEGEKVLTIFNGDIVEFDEWGFMHLHKKEIEMWLFLDTITMLVDKKPFINWIDTLPFPLASILWLYISEINVEHKIDHLLNFFEALSEFIVILMLSAFAKDKDFYIQECRQIKPTKPNWFKKPTFDTWNQIGRWLSKAIRRIHSYKDKSKWEKCKELFGNPEEKFLNMFMQKNLYKFLDEVKNYRNAWKGHPGVTPRVPELEKRLSILEDYIVKVRKQISDKFASVLFITPLNMKFKEGIYYIQVNKIIGIRYPFKEIEVRTHTQMEGGKLYVLHGNYKTPIELLPFIRVISSPKIEENACYFYNRIEGKYARFVSYHYNVEPEINLSKEGLNYALSLLQDPNNLNND